MNPIHASADWYQLDKMLAYLKGELNPKEEQLLEKLIGEDEGYAETLQLLDEQLREEGEQAILARANLFKHALAEAHLAESLAPVTKVVPFYQKPWVMAAAAVVAILIAIFLWPAGKLQKNDLDNLAQGYLVKSYVPQVTTMGQTQEDLSRVAQAFAEGRGDEEIGTLIKLVEDESLALPPAKKTELILTLAHYNLRQGHPDLARTRLVTLPQGATKRQQAQADWFIALSYLYQKNAAAAQPYLEKVAEDGPKSLRQESEGILKRLDL
ncbi:MAG: hypothetical protein AAF804_14370 [Bacteroidota bacterium]